MNAPRFRARFNPFAGGPGADESLTPPPSDVLEFHRSMPEYMPTPLYSLPGLAEELGMGQLLLKDESQRFGLKAFKALGASYAIHRLLKKTGDGNPASGSLTFATATDGNHGRAVAWSARRLRQKAVVYVPAIAAEARIRAIESEGAECVLVDGAYDDAVKRAAAEAKKNGWQLVSDTAWKGYAEIPGWVMAGYQTLFCEIDVQVREQTLPQPDAVFVQSGVGGLAYAAVQFYRRADRKSQPKLVSVEPVEADGLLESISTEDGGIRSSRGNQETIMAGLNCATPSLAAWPALRAHIDYFLAVDDIFAEEAMGRLFHPSSGDPRIVSGESGAAGLAGLFALCRKPELEEDKEELGLDEESTVLLINTEGNTDPVNFEKIVEERP